jgi:hypothetical protein
MGLVRGISRSRQGKRGLRVIGVSFSAEGDYWMWHIFGSSTAA